MVVGKAGESRREDFSRCLEVAVDEFWCSTTGALVRADEGHEKIRGNFVVTLQYAHYFAINKEGGRPIDIPDAFAWTKLQTCQASICI